MMNWIYYNHKALKDFGVYISGSGVFDAPERDVSKIEIPGRNGDLTFDNGRYRNIVVTYPAFIITDFKRCVSGLRNYLLTTKGYNRLEDTYHPDEYRLAKWDGKFSADPTDDLKAANFNLNFDCYPQRFLKSGENARTFTVAGQMFNDTLNDAKPLIRAYGTGTFTIGNISITITEADEYTDIDCDIQEAYKENFNVNCNDNIVLEDGQFPVLEPGINLVTMIGITRLDIIPRWWRL